MLAYKDSGGVRLISRQGKDHTARFPDIVKALRRLETPLVIFDGEVAVYDRQLVSRFEWLRHASPPELSTPSLFMVFDCLHTRGKDLRSQPQQVIEHGYEGLVAKDPQSPYVGGRTLKWLKVKQPGRRERRTQ